MTESRDDKVLDEYLGRDSPVSRAYRDMEPADVSETDIPATLDAAVIAEARAAVAQQRSKQRPVWTRWTAPLAIAASAVLGIAVLLEVGVDEKVEYPAARVNEAPAAPAPVEAQSDTGAAAAIEQVTEQLPLAASPPPQEALTAQPKQSQLKTDRAAQRKAATRVDQLEIAETAQDRGDAFAVSPEPPAPAAPSAADLNRELTTRAAAADKLMEESRSAREREEPSYLQASRAAAAAQIPPTAAASGQMIESSAGLSAARLAPDLWLEQIRALRRDGKVLEADEQWRQFSAAYPTFVVPEKDPARPVTR